MCAKWGATDGSTAKRCKMLDGGEASVSERNPWCDNNIFSRSQWLCIVFGSLRENGLDLPGVTLATSWLAHPVYHLASLRDAPNTAISMPYCRDFYVSALPHFHISLCHYVKNQLRFLGLIRTFPMGSTIQSICQIRLIYAK